MKWSGLAIPSTFPPDRRPIYLHPTALMNRKNREQSYPLIAEAIGKILCKESTKGLVHTVSYDLCKFLAQYNYSTSRPIFSYSTSGEKDRIIKKYLGSNNGVIFAPSLERGIDLPQTTCRFVVVVKLPFPNLGTKQVSARLYRPGGQLWYNVKTVRSLVQMTGRGMRSETDYCNSYILDKQFITLLWKRNKHLLPQWWREALVWNAGQL